MEQRLFPTTTATGTKSVPMPLTPTRSMVRQAAAGLCLSSSEEAVGVPLGQLAHNQRLCSARGRVHDTMLEMPTSVRLPAPTSVPALDPASNLPVGRNRGGQPAEATSHHPLSTATSITTSTTTPPAGGHTATFRSHQHSFDQVRLEHSKRFACRIESFVFNILTRLLVASLLFALASSSLSLGTRLSCGPSGRKNGTRCHWHRSHHQI